MSFLKQGAVLYAKSLASLHDFYRNVIGLEPVTLESDHAVLESPVFQLVILQTPEPVASTIRIDSPPAPRSETPIKLVFPVASIDNARTIAAAWGGRFNSRDREWIFHDCRVCDGIDPEGNVVQIRQQAQ